MKKNRLFKQGLAVLLSLSMSLGPCAPGSFAAFADNAGVSSEVEASSEVETDAGETGTDTEEEAGPQEEAGSQEEAEVSEEKSEEAEEDSVSAGDSAREEISNDDAGESNGGGDEDDPDAGSRDEVSPSGDVNEEDKSESETDPENKEDTSAPNQKEENTVPEEADTASETAASEAETEAGDETEAAAAAVNDETGVADASENDETEAEGEVKNSEERHVLQAEVDETMISVIYDDGVFPENVTLEVRKVDEDSAEQEEISETVGPGLFLKAFEIKVLDEEENVVQPNTDTGKVYVRFHNLKYAFDEDEEDPRQQAFSVYALDDAEDGTADKLELLKEEEWMLLSEETAEISDGTVIDDVSSAEDKEKENSSTSFAVQVKSCGLIVLTWEKEESSLITSELLLADEDIFASGKCGDNLTWTMIGEDNNYTLTISGEGEMWDTGYSGLHWTNYDNTYSKIISSVVINDGVTRIGWGAFQGYSNLRSITIPDSVTYIGFRAFQNCTSLSSISIPSNVTTIDGAFIDCSSLRSITIPDGVTSILSTFSGCSSLSNITIPDSVTSIGGAFCNCSSLSSITIPSSVINIDGAFLGCNSLSSITIPDSVTSIGDATFESCSSLSSITIPDSVKVICESVFSNCSSLSSITIPDGVTTIGDWAFSDCDNLESITIPDSVTSIGNNAFFDCDKLSSIMISDSVTRIEDYTFQSCDKLSSISIPSGVTSIGGHAFLGCNSLSSITIPDSVTNIGEEAFRYCNSMADVYYGGSEEQWQAITINVYNEPLLNATIHYNSASKTQSGIIRQGTGWAMRWKCKYTVDSEGGKSNPELEIYMSGIDSDDNWKFSVSDTDTDISPWLNATGFQKSDFKSISVRGTSQNPIYIISEQFAGYTGVTEVNLAHIYSFGSGAFKDCTGLKKIDSFDSDLVSIGSYAFKNDSNLATILGTASATKLESIGKEAFANTAITSIILNKSVDSIENDSFESCDSLTISCYKDSYAHQYAVSNSIPYVLLDKASELEILLRSNSTEYNNTLSLVCAELSKATYSVEGVDVKSKLVEYGFDENLIRSRNYAPDGSDGTLAFTIGTMECLGDDADYIVVIAAQGSTNCYELLKDATAQPSKFYSGVGGRFSVYDIVYDFYDGINNAFHPEAGKKYKVLLTGHSLGGASVNLMAADLIDRSKKYATAEDPQFEVFCYTFGAINSIDYKGPVVDGYESIHNVYNLLDTFSPYQQGGLLPTGMGKGYGKFGYMEMFAHDYRDVIHYFILPLGQIALHINHDMHNYVEAVEAGRVINSKYRTNDYSVVGCPVNVDILLDKELVGRIEDNEVILTNEGLDLEVAGDTKLILYNDNQQYELHLSAYDEGIMTFGTQYITQNNEVKLISDVTLEADKLMMSTLGEGIAVQDITLYVVDDEERQLAEVLEDGTEIPLQAVTGVSLDKSSLTIVEGGTAALLAEVHPENASNKEVTWSSSDPSVAEVDQDGKVTGVKTGTATVTAKTVDGNFTADCVVTVKAMDPVEVFIRRLYTTCLSREADAGGLEYWKGRINSGSLKGIGLASEFVFSKEFKSKNYCNEHFVKQIYPALMGREPDAGGLTYWVGQLDSSKMNRESLLNSFTSSAEYKNLCAEAGIELGATMKVPEYGVLPYGPCAVCGNETKVVQFAERMYTVCLDRAAETGGLAYWSKGLYEQTITGKSILENFFLSSEIQGKNLTNREYVRRIYKAMLDRDPDGSGWDYWEGRLNSGASPTAVIAGFIDSNEFTGICSDYGIKRK